MQQALPEEVDFAAAQAAMLRRRQVAQLLAQQSMQPLQGQMVSGHYVPPSKLQGLAQLVSGLAGGKLEKELDAKEADLSKKRMEALTKGLADYSDLRFGTPDQPMGPPTEAGEYGVQPGKKADPRRAAIQAVASQMPELRQLGMMDLQGLGKQEAETWGTTPVKLANGKLGVVSNRGNFRELTGAQAAKSRKTVEGRLVDEETGDVVRDYRPQFRDEVIAGDLYQRDVTGTNKLDKKDNAPRISTHVKVSGPQQGESEFLKKLGQGRAEQFITAEKEAAQAYSTKNAVSQMQELDKAGVFSGPTAGLATSLGAFAESLNLPVDKSKLANSEAFQQQFALQIGKYLADSSVGRTLTDKDRELLEKTMPSLLTSPQGRQYVYNMLGRAAETSIKRHANLQGQLTQAYPEGKGMLMVNPVDQAPPGVPAPVTDPMKPAGAPRRMTLEEYRQYLQQQGR